MCDAGAALLAARWIMLVAAWKQLRGRGTTGGWGRQAGSGRIARIELANIIGRSAPIASRNTKSWPQQPARECTDTSRFITSRCGKQIAPCCQPGTLSSQLMIQSYHLLNYFFNK
jgi:hypothetical protein